MSGPWRRLARSDGGAVAPTVALTLFALIAAGGVAFDYSRMASMDSELQNAADQAALAAATQLDGKTGAITRATSAAQAMVTNRTLMANDRDGQGAERSPDVGVTASNVIFYTRNDSAPDRIGSITTSDTDARFVSVTVDSRRAYYALTPIVAALNSGDLNATAIAGLGSSICKVPPIMMCNPAETGSSTAFNPSDWVGRGIRLVANGAGASWGPGVFGYLGSDLGKGANALEQALGSNTPRGDCQHSDSVTVEPGVQTSVTDALNTRFDIYESGLVGYCSPGTCSPAVNNRKDVVHTDFTPPPPGGGGGGGGGGSPPGQAPNCGLTGNNPWTLPSVQYLPDPSTGAQPAALGNPSNMGHPRDICHSVSSSGNCASGRIGDGNWDRNLYFAVNHNGATDLAAAANWAGKSAAATSGPTALTRYDVYLWEISASRLGRRLSSGSGSSALYSYAAAQCGPPAAPGPSQADRRKLTVAMVNCIADSSDLNGSATVQPEKWVEVFMVEPSMGRSRTSSSDVYVEMIGEATSVTNGNNMVVRRDVPYLVR